MVESSKKLKPWRQQVTDTALALNVPPLPDGAPVAMVADFYFARPRSVSIKKRRAMTVKPDVDKLLRAIFDSCKGVLYADDANVVDAHPRKHYAALGEPERVEIQIQEAM